MSKTLTAAIAVSGVNIIGATILLFLADLGRADWWHIFNLSLDAETNPALQNITNGEVCAQQQAMLSSPRQNGRTTHLLCLQTLPYFSL